MADESILIVDDLFPNRFLIKEIIKSLSYSYAECENGKECIEYLENHVPRLVLMDIEMPVMNGLETTKYIREHFNPPVSTIPIIALTAHNPDIFIDDYSDVPIDDILTKPYTMERVKAMLEKFLD